MNNPVIIHTSSMPEWNGETNRVLMDLTAAADAGYKTALLSPERAVLSEKAAQKGIKVHYFSFENNPLRRLSEIFKLRRLLRSEPAAIIHTHSSKDTWLVAQQALLFGKRFGFARTRHNSNRIRDSFFNRLLYRRIDRLVVVSESVKQRFDNLVKKHVIAPENIEIISSAFNGNMFRPSPEARQQLRSQLGVDPDELLLGFVGRVCQGKGIDYLIDAIKVLFPRYERLKFVAVGECSVDNIEQRLASPNGRRVILPGFRGDIHNYYQAIDIVVLPSLKEGLPTTIIEAMACGKAIVATDVGGIPEVITDDTNGLLVEPRDSASLIESIQRLIEDESLRDRLGQAALDTATRNYSYDVLKRRTTQLYKSMVIANGS